MKETIEQYSEAQIIERIINGEKAFFEILIRRNNAVLYKIGRSYNYSHEDTQDLMQDTFIDAYRSLIKFESRSSFKTWITKIMLNNCYRKSQKIIARNKTQDDATDRSVPKYAYSYSDAYKPLVMKELGTVIENALQQLSLDYRMVFSLREINGFSVEETAETLNISQSNVKTRLNRAKNILRKRIEKSYKPEDIFEFNLVYCDAIVYNVMKKLNDLPRTTIKLDELD
jgi:RNA polymerase sigma factor (sigma-70 family)